MLEKTAKEEVEELLENSIPKSLVIEKMLIDKDKLNKSVNANLEKAYKARIEFGEELLGDDK